MEKIKVRGLVKISGTLFFVWGLLVAVKSLYDLFWGEPESNRYSLKPWEFVSREQWFRYAGFELVYGLACLALAWTLFQYAAKLPEFRTRPIPKPKVSLF
ncbi:MAG: hypothetical protein HY399_02315 [Elusimicrobia bacterium]|nr:hypothetical protein [Elusimicrobiota bacterium]